MRTPRLAGQSQRARGSASQATNGALLAGILFDGAGNRMTPTYSGKGKRRYHYYVSAPMVRGGKGDGIRVPAHDLEALVCGAVANNLREPDWLDRLIGDDAPRDAGASRALIEAGATLARALSAGGELDAGGDGHTGHEDDERSGESGRASDDRDWVRALMDSVIVSRSIVSIALNRAAVIDALIESGARMEQESADDDAPPLKIDVPAQPLRCGKQVRLIVGDVSSENRSPDPKLIRLIANAHRWFEDLRTGRAKTIAEIAARDRQQVSHVSRTLPLAFLAPDIVEMILDGRQPPTLMVERLKARRQPVPMDWGEQRVRRDMRRG